MPSLNEQELRALVTKIRNTIVGGKIEDVIVIDDPYADKEEEKEPSVALVITSRAGDEFTALIHSGSEGKARGWLTIDTVPKPVPSKRRRTFTK